MTPTPEPDAAAPAGGPELPAPGTPSAPPAAEASSCSDASAVSYVLAQVRERGFITTGEIFAAFPDLEPDADELRELWEMFESRGIKVLDEIAAELQLEHQRRGAQQGAGAEPRRRTEHRPTAASRPGGATARRATSS